MYERYKFAQPLSGEFPSPPTFIEPGAHVVAQDLVIEESRQRKENRVKRTRQAAAAGQCLLRTLNLDVFIEL
jgi:hypothetical protein